MTDLESSALTLAQAFLAGARARPDARLVISSQVRAADVRLEDLVRRGQVFGEHLRLRGIAAGDVIAVQLPAWSEWMIACVGVAHAGAVLLPVVSIYGAKELGFILRQSKAKLLITPDVWRNADYATVAAECGDLPDLETHVMVGKAAPGTVAWDDLERPAAITTPVSRTPDDLAMLVYTSGTTADPKGVKHSSRTLLAELHGVAEARRALVDEVTLSPWPPGHVAGACQMMRYIVQGVPLVMMDQWSGEEAARLIEQHRVVSSSFTPFHLTGILDAADRDGRDLSSLVSCLVDAAPVPPTLISHCAERGMRTFRSYGSSEHPTVTTGYPEDSMDKRLTTEGRAMLGCEMRFVDEEGDDVPADRSGEIVTRGSELFLGYFDENLDAAAFLPGGWYRTGDIGRYDEDGYLLITDRKKDVIIRGGENISSREVEDLLFGHPGVFEAAVVAAPDERMGEIVRAYIIPRPGAEVTLDNVRAFFVEAGVAKQKTPEQIIIIQELPRNATGKVLKHELRAQAKAEGFSQVA